MASNQLILLRSEAAPLFNFLLHYLILLLQRPLHRGRGGKREGKWGDELKPRKGIT